jgi:hypothetical protein
MNSIDWYKKELNSLMIQYETKEITILEFSDKYYEIGCIAQEMHKDDIESAIIKDCATESTSAASSYSDGYKDGYNRAIELTKWTISNLVPPSDAVQ